jgi:hypothetical protein
VNKEDKQDEYEDNSESGPVILVEISSSNSDQSESIKTKGMVVYSDV